MLPPSPLLLVFPAALFWAAQGAGDLQGVTFPADSAGFDPADPCMVVSPPCMSEADRFSLEALRSIHQMMDDDQDGGIEVEESVEFIIEDMKQQQTNKHSNLHREDQHITVEELWRGWKSSEVHNWTQDDVLHWLKEFVELSQYERNFKDFKVNGNTLPRIAANEPSFLSGQLRVQDQRDKQKLTIKALDVVLFGPPTRPPHNYMKDLLLIVSVVMGVGGCWFAQAQNKSSKVHIAKMMKDLESLQRAEQSLIDLQEQLERAQEEKRNVAEEKQSLEEKMRDEIMGAQEEAHRLHELRQGAVSELSRLRYAEEELEQVRGALKQAEKDMQASWTVSEVLQQWLQLTHEVEVQYYNVKKQSAELQLATAKEEAERIKKKRSSVLGTLHVAHSSSLDQVDQKILEAKNALSEVTACLRERLHRWQQIELLCGFPIIRNPGLANLTAQLYSDSIALGLPRLSQSSCSCHSSIHGSIEDLLDESTSPILPQMPGKKQECGSFPILVGSSLVPVSESVGLESGDEGSSVLQRNELEMSAGSLRRRMARMPKEDAESSIDTPTRKISWDRFDIPREMPKQFIVREELGVSESGSLPARHVQPDLMLTSQVPWQSSSDFFTVGPLSQLVYDGILEKSCSSMFSAPNLSAGRLLAEMEQPLPPPPPRVVLPAPSSSPSEAADDRSKDKEKSKKPLKLKNLFKKKNEQTPEKL
uniref:Stromal interaction molecule 2 n=1 Tax=Amphilophus citrinellus TaxID=61819 RepID=A0A3Q0S6K8_AMPCI